MNLKTVGTPKRQVGPREVRWWQIMPALDADLMGPKSPCTKGGIAGACAKNLAGPQPPFLRIGRIGSPEQFMTDDDRTHVIMVNMDNPSIRVCPDG